MKSLVLICLIVVGFSVSNCRCRSEPEITENPIQDPRFWSEIPAGTFMAGSPETEPCSANIAEAQVEVTLTHPFIMKKTKVTQGEWKAVGYPNPEPRKDPELPFASANWFEALAFCNKISKLEGLDTCYDLSSCKGKIGSGCPEIDEDGSWKCSLNSNTPKSLYVCSENVRKYESDPYSCPGYRLPTRAEWEYAARAGTTTANYFGEITTNDWDCYDDPAVSPIAWYCDNSNLQSQPVGQKQPNAWDLYDMFGNTKEWIDEVFTARDLAYNELKAGWNPENTEDHLTDPIGAPYDIDNRRGTSGCYYASEGCDCRSGKSSGSYYDMRRSSVGFRPVRTIQSISDGGAQSDGGE